MLPNNLVELVRTQRAILFLGAGASIGALHAKNAPIPKATELRDAICDKFLGGELKTKSLAAVAEIAANESSLPELQGFVAGIFLPFQPAPHHLLIPTFRWRAIATTNLDLILERAYQKASKHQALVPFIKDTEAFDTKLRATVDGLEYIKLHGSIDHPNEVDAPFILGQEQYARYDTNRKRLYGRLRDLCSEYPVIFCGYSIEDAHIQDILFSLSDPKIGRPMYYSVTPDATDYEVRYWAKHRVTVVPCTFEQMLTTLDPAIPEHARTLSAALGGGSASIRSFYTVANVIEDPAIIQFLGQDVTHIRRDMAVQPQDPRAFYKGYDLGWGCITQSLDAARRITDSILVDAVLLDELDESKVRLFVVKGPAGQGKTVALKRVAWEAATSYGKLVLFHHQDGALRPDAIREICALTRTRVFLVVDRASLVRDQLRLLLDYAVDRDLPLTVIAAERSNEWDTYCDFLSSKVTQDFYIDNLSKQEIEGLLALLETHDALGLLKELSPEQRFDRFASRANHQLLVALHETTQGKPFEEIVHDEYLGVPDPDARRLYFEICCLHQFGAPVRAGLIKRTTGIGFEDFKGKFLTPLRGLVGIGRDNYSGDFTYRARHQHVAEMVFYTVAATEEERFNALIDMTSGMNTSYSSDRESFMRIVKGRNVRQLFSDVSLGRLFFDHAQQVDPDNAFVLQQRAIFEMQHPNGGLDQAEAAANEAAALYPESRNIAHTQAEVARRLAKATDDPLRKDAYRRSARSHLPNDSSRSGYDFQTRIRLNLDELEELIANNPQGASNKRIVELSKDVEVGLEMAFQAFPHDEHFEVLEADYRHALEENKNALDALKRAFEINPRQDWLAVRLAKKLRESGDLDGAITVLKKCVAENPNSKTGNRRLAQYLDEAGVEKQTVLDYLRQSFVRGDGNYDNQFFYARQLFITQAFKEAKEAFEQLNDRAPPDFRINPGAIIKERGKDCSFHGEIIRKEDGYALIRSRDCDEILFAYRGDSSSDAWDSLKRFDAVNFKIGFSRRGARALSVEKTDGKI